MTVESGQVGQEVFLGNEYLDLGINSSGTLGTRATAPAGFQTDATQGYIRLGMVADTDGFGTGKATSLHDVMLLGTPIETFSVGYNIGSKHYVNTNSERDGVSQIAGTASNLSDATTARAGWTGTTAQNVKVNQVMSLTSDAKFVRVDVTLTNTTDTTLTDLRYMRSIDPDQGPTFSTNNKIIQQGGDNTGGALIAAYASGTSNPFYFYSQDERAIVSAYGFENRDPYAAAAHDTPQAIGYGINSDVSINIDFDIGSLAPGQSTTVTYYMGVTDNLDATIAAINAAAGSSAPPPPPANHAPVAVADSATVVAGAAVTGNVLTNDTDADKDALHAALKTGPAHGTVTIADDGSYKYTAAAGYTGTDSFTYTASDGKTSSTSTVSITVTAPPNHAPVAVADSATVVAGAAVTGNVLTNDTDADKDALHAALKTGPAHGTVTVADDGSYKYTAAAGYTGTDSFTYTASDGKTSSTSTVSITVTAPPNHAPVAVADSATVVAGAAVTGNVLTNDTDADKDTLHAALKTGPAHGTVTLADDGSYKYTAAAGYTGTDSFTYTASDGKTSSTSTVSITVTAPPNHAPVAVADSATVVAGAAVTGNVLTNDTDADKDTLHAALKTGPAHGTVTVADDGSYKYTAAAGYTGADSFTYTASDGKTSSTSTVSITVTAPPNHAPVAVADSATVVAGAAVTGNVLTNDTDADKDTLHAALKTGPAHGTVTVADDGSYKYTAAAGYTGADSFTYTASDGKTSSTSTVSITVTAPPNHAPVAVADSATVVAGAAVTGNVLTNDTDADKDALHAALKTGPAHGTVTVADDGSYKYTAAVGYTGADSFTYTASDGKTSSTSTVSITVTAPPNHAPVGVDDSATVAAGAAVTGNVLTNDTDADSDPLHAKVATGAGHGVAVINDDGTFTYTPAAGYSGADSFTYVVSDGKASSTATVNVTVTPPPNHAPVAANDAVTVAAGGIGSGNVLTNDTDADKDVLHAALKTGASHGVVTIADDGTFHYAAAAGFFGTDSFTYTASDGHTTSTGTVVVTVEAPTAPAGPVGGSGPASTDDTGIGPSSPGWHDGSASTNDVMVATSGQDKFYFDQRANSGADTVTGFGHDDMIITEAKLFDSNGDGRIDFQNNRVAIDVPKGKDTAHIAGVSSLLYMGQGSDGHYVYVNAAQTPKGAQESKMGTDILKGDAGDKTAQTFFFDTNLKLNLGADQVTNFGAKDVIVTTSALQTDGAGHVDLTGGKLALIDGAGDNLGTAAITDTGNAALHQLEFDGSVTHDGLTYFVYSAVGSAAGVHNPIFG